MVMVNTYHMVSLRSNIAQKVLNYFFINPEEARYVNELAGLLNVDPKNLDTKLKEFEAYGLLQSEFRGKQKYYFLNKKFPLLKEYEQIVMKTWGIEALLKELLAKFPKIEEAYIFGSYASNKMDVNSDIDILVIGNHKALDVQSAILPLQSKLNREFNIVDMTKSELEDRKGKKDPFIKEVFSKPLIKLI
jgi:predicted nucleotidyltransferase